MISGNQTAGTVYWTAGVVGRHSVPDGDISHRKAGRKRKVKFGKIFSKNHKKGIDRIHGFVVYFNRIKGKGSTKPDKAERGDSSVRCRNDTVSPGAVRPGKSLKIEKQ